MNYLLILAGAVLLGIGISNFLHEHDPEPKNGAIQIRKQGERYWVYKYVKYPGWNVHRLAESREHALAIKAQEEPREYEAAKVEIIEETKP